MRWELREHLNWPLRSGRCMIRSHPLRSIGWSRIQAAIWTWSQIRRVPCPSGPQFRTRLRSGASTPPSSSRGPISSHATLFIVVADLVPVLSRRCIGPLGRSKLGNGAAHSRAFSSILAGRARGDFSCALANLPRHGNGNPRSGAPGWPRDKATAIVVARGKA